MDVVIEPDQFILPGVDVQDFVQKQCEHKKQIIVGPGLRKCDQQLLTCRAGRLRFDRNPDRIWIDSIQKKYQPVKGDRVVGIVLNCRGNQVKVDIGTAEYAMLNVLAFEGATKKNRPDIKVKFKKKINQVFLYALFTLK